MGEIEENGPWSLLGAPRTVGEQDTDNHVERDYLEVRNAAVGRRPTLARVAASLSMAAVM